jgi:hypothetical protein
MVQNRIKLESRIRERESGEWELRENENENGESVRQSFIMSTWVHAGVNPKRTITDDDDGGGGGGGKR